MDCPRGDHGEMLPEAYRSFRCIICGYQYYPQYTGRVVEEQEKGPRPRMSQTQKAQRDKIIANLAVSTDYTYREIQEITGYGRATVENVARRARRADAGLDW